MSAAPARTAAMSAAVALVAAQVHGLDVPRELLVGDVGSAELEGAQAWLSSLLITHATAGLSGPALLELIGKVIAYVEAGGRDGL